MKFSVLASGSGGNSCYIETPKCRILIDAGLSCRELVNRLSLLKVNPSTIDAVIITHEHHDHIKGAGPFVRKFKVPLVINRGTLQSAKGNIGHIPVPILFNTGDTITWGDLDLHFFTKCHDAADPVGILVCHNGIRLGIATDLGRSTWVVEDRLRGCRGLILEFNHDEEMLEHGPYPMDLKRRIRGPEGHLSNSQAGSLLSSILDDDLKCLVLAHLSEINNNSEKALAVAKHILDKNGQRDIEIAIGLQDCCLPMIELA